MSQTPYCRTEKDLTHLLSTNIVVRRIPERAEKSLLGISIQIWPRQHLPELPPWTTFFNSSEIRWEFYTITIARGRGNNRRHRFSPKPCRCGPKAATLAETQKRERGRLSKGWKQPATLQGIPMQNQQRAMPLIWNIARKGSKYHALPQQLPGPAHVEGGPSLPQHRSAGFVGNLPVGLTAACADNSFLRFRPPQFPQTTSSVSLLAIRISVLRPQSRHSNS
jgi:hypothetical protein